MHLSPEEIGADVPEPQSKDLGNVYTPTILAEWVAHLLVENLADKQNPRVLDPACGDGILLQHVKKRCPRAQLVGVDIDPEAIETARRKVKAELHRGDALIPSESLSLVDGWKDLLGCRSIDGIIANPPWGADHNHETRDFVEAGYTVAQGQYDTFDLFIESALAAARDGAILVFIVPDSIFGHEHRPIRRKLTTQTTILRVARLGEGFFGGVFRGCGVLVVKKSKPSGNTVKCTRITKEQRKILFNGKEKLEDISKESTHTVSQSKWAKSNNFNFLIDITNSDDQIISQIDSFASNWDEWVDYSRGVEISKTGDRLFCPECGWSSPVPKQGSRTCRNPDCGAEHSPDGAKVASIIKSTLPENADNWKPLAVGEDVDRYKCTPSRWIKLGVPGVKYKDPDTYSKSKILVRKTGIGIKACIDESGAYTNQVVYQFSRNSTHNVPKFYLYYLLGVMSSRLICAYDLKKRGETEWRSHPYLTKTDLISLPIPRIDQGAKKWDRAKRIASLAKELNDGASNQSTTKESVDLKLEQEVALLYGLDVSDLEWALRVLDEAEGLEAIRAMRLETKSKLID
jgi:predicted RNA methylase